MNVSASSDDPHKTYWLIYSFNHNRILQNLGNDGFSLGFHPMNGGIARSTAYVIQTQSLGFFSTSVNVHSRVPGFGV